MKPIAFERVSLADAKRVHDGPPPRKWNVDWAGRRAAANDPQALDAATRDWIDALPAALQPQRLAVGFLRITTRIAQLWNQPARCSAYLSDLMIVRRASRRGFPGDVAREIGNLAVHYETLHPAGRGWTAAR